MNKEIPNKQRRSAPPTGGILSWFMKKSKKHLKLLKKIFPDDHVTQRIDLWFITCMGVSIFFGDVYLLLATMFFLGGVFYFLSLEKPKKQSIANITSAVSRIIIYSLIMLAIVGLVEKYELERVHTESALTLFLLTTSACVIFCDYVFFLYMQLMRRNYPKAANPKAAERATYIFWEIESPLGIWSCLRYRYLKRIKDHRSQNRANAVTGS